MRAQDIIEREGREIAPGSGGRHRAVDAGQVPTRYTTHGHAAANGPLDVMPALVARCGGPGLCQQCGHEAYSAGETPRDIR